MVARERAGEGDVGRLRVLLVAPRVSSSLRETLAATLELEHADADGALARVSARRSDVVLLDSELREAELAHLSGALRASVRAPIVLAAPEVSGEMIGLALRIGADSIYAQAWDPMVLQRVARRPPLRGRGDEGDDVALRPQLVGASDAMRETWRLTLLAAESEASVTITGETGTGKEVVARLLHRFSPRRHGPFVAINCAALPETLLDAELFGHEKGAFTGAESQRKGTFERAAGGTLFLDEIGEMPLGLQAKLLRVLQERTVQRLGGDRIIDIDTRVVAATNRPLREEVSEGRFRADLFYRLCSLAIHVPPLRERRADALALWERRLAELAERDGRPCPKASPAVQRWLLQYAWPGNLRELENVVRHLATVTTGDLIQPEDLPEWAAARVDPTSATRRTSHGLAGMSMKQIERAAILETYEALGTVRATAEALGISPRKLQYRLKEYRDEGYLPADDRAQDHAPKRLQVLLAEDDDELRAALTELLESEGCDVIAVRSGSASLEHLGAALLLDRDRAPIDMILADVRMPGISGLQLLEGVRARGWQIPVVVMSAFGDPRTRAEAEALGATAFLDKPFAPGALRDVIRAASAP
jgi:DNA-binding NtrC family response regulator